MNEPKYPIGIQTFSELIRGGYTYVDKTSYIPILEKGGKYYFLSRPRRFGKSLLLSTLHAYFSGRHDLFKNLYIDNETQKWIPSPVLHFDLNSEDYSREDSLESILNSHLIQFEEEYDLVTDTRSVSQRFRQLILKAYEKSGERVVILVDEYDKPLLGLEEDSKLYIKNQSLLKGFFGNLKSMDQYIRFAFVTGVARFSKVSIFSDLNNLNDISLSEKFADICGWTELEMIENFSVGIESLAEKRGEDFEITLKALREHYDGYMFAEGGSRLYNPFSVLLALYHRKIESYWFETGTPTFLARKIKATGIAVTELNGIKRSRESLVSLSSTSDNIIPLMFQTGYLTIASYDNRTNRYELKFPNKEVETGFARNLLSLYAPVTKNPDGPFGIFSFQDDLIEGNPESFMKRLGNLLKSIPYELQGEHSYQSIAYLVCILSGTDAIAEQHCYKGRTDIEVFTSDYIYIFEFKFNKSAEEAIVQIHNRDYAGRYDLDPRTVYLIGANFVNNQFERGLESFIIENI